MSGANRDAQDVNGETPLFVAAKEGCAHSARVLLDFCAIRNSIDNMGRLPRDVAQENLHPDIVNILDKYEPVNHLDGKPLHSFMTRLCDAGLMSHAKRKSTKTRGKSRSLQSKDSAHARSQAFTSILRSYPEKKQVSDLLKFHWFWVRSFCGFTAVSSRVRVQLGFFMIYQP